MTPKYYIGQKVMVNDLLVTVMSFQYGIVELSFDSHDEYGYMYDTSNNKSYPEDELTRPPAKLEFGYCAVGDMIVNEDGESVVILDVRTCIFSRSTIYEHKNFWGNYTYEEAREYGWKIKDQEADKMDEYIQKLEDNGYKVTKE